MTKRFRQDEDGAAMVEYSILIGLITAAVIGLIIAVGAWIGVKWTALCGVLPGAICT